MNLTERRTSGEGQQLPPIARIAYVTQGAQRHDDHVEHEAVNDAAREMPSIQPEHLPPQRQFPKAKNNESQDQARSQHLGWLAQSGSNLRHQRRHEQHKANPGEKALGH